MILLVSIRDSASSVLSATRSGSPSTSSADSDRRSAWPRITFRSFRRSCLMRSVMNASAFVAVRERRASVRARAP
jgi:hypothetical protein